MNDTMRLYNLIYLGLVAVGLVIFADPALVAQPLVDHLDDAVGDGDRWITKLGGANDLRRTPLVVPFHRDINGSVFASGTVSAARSVVGDGDVARGVHAHAQPAIGAFV